MRAAGGIQREFIGEGYLGLQMLLQPGEDDCERFVVKGMRLFQSFSGGKGWPPADRNGLLLDASVKRG